MKMIERPCVLIPGPRKCGNTTLFDVISRHDHVDTPQYAEPHFFSMSEKVIRENMDWYLDIYSDSQGKMMLDGTTHYFFSDRALRNIRNHFKNVKIILLFRDPVKRAHSAFWHMKKKVPSKEKRTFEEIIESIEGPGFRKIVESENNELQKAIKENQIDEDYLGKDYLKKKCDAPFGSDFEDPLWFYKYFQGSLYSRKVERWEEKYDQVKIIFLEEMIRDPEDSIREIFEFLGLEPSNSLLKLPHKNKTMVPSSRAAKKVKRMRDVIIDEPKIPSIAKLITSYFHNTIITNLFYEPKPKISKENYIQARSIMKKEYEYWYSRNDNLIGLWDIEC